MDCHLVSTAYIVRENRVLLIFHKKLQLWLPPGGHVEANETADQAAVREAQEEVRIPIEVVSFQPVLAGPRRPLPLPFSADIHNVGDHDHWNLSYLARPLALPADGKFNTAEIEQMRWFSAKELAEPIILPGVRAQALRALELLR